MDFGATQFWTRVNSLDSPWGLDDLTAAVTEVGHKIDVIMIPKVEGAEDIHYADRLVAQLARELPGLGLGEVAGELLASARVLPRQLLGAGYPFQHADIRAALAWAVA